MILNFEVTSFYGMKSAFSFLNVVILLLNFPLNYWNLAILVTKYIIINLNQCLMTQNTILEWPYKKYYWKFNILKVESSNLGIILDFAATLITKIKSTRPFQNKRKKLIIHIDELF